MKHTVYSFLTSGSSRPLALRKVMPWSGARLLLFCLVLGLGMAVPAHATHFRYGTVTWRTVKSDPTLRTIEFKVSQSWRRSFYGNPVLGASLRIGELTFGDGGSSSIPLVVTSVDAAADYFYGEATIRHTYAAVGSYNAAYTACCRLATLSNNPSEAWYIGSVVSAGSGNSSPVSTLQPVVNLASGQALATFQMPATDPDGDPLSYALATTNDMNQYPFNNPPGLAVNSTTGVVTFNTINSPVGRLYNGVIKVSDGHTSILVDFIMKVTNVSTPPVFDYSITPPNGFVFQLAPGQPFGFQVRATDSDAGDLVSLQGIGLPPSARMTPALPAMGNPVLGAFSWTPTINNLGTNVINFVAQDVVGMQTTTSIIINVSLRPVFDVPPTPSNGSVFQSTPGTPISTTLQASTIVPDNTVRIVSAAGLPAGATFSSALPTPAARVTSTQLNWTPVLADWGLHSAVFTARDGFNEQAEHALQFIVNSPPVFVSAPSPASLKVLSGHAFNYDIVITDPDTPYGDELEVETAALPAWLALVDNGDGTGTLSGTPTVTEAGLNPVTLVAADLYHHGASYGLITQAFNINVIPCNTQLSATGTNISCNGKADGRIVLAVSGGTAPFTYAWTGPNSYTSTAASPVGLVIGTYTVTTTDANGCHETTQATLAEPALEMPQISSVPSMTVANDPGACGAVVAYATPQGTHTCRNVTTAMTAGLASGAQFPIGTTTVAYTVTDDAGNTAACSFTVTVTDTERPTIVAPAAMVASTTAGQCSATNVALGRATAGDNCAGAVVTNNAPAVFAMGATTVTWTATDVAGLTATATQVVTVVDTERPVLTLPAAIVRNAPATQCGVVVAFGPTATDNCAGAMVETSPASGSTFPVGTSTVRVTATDASGNTTTDSFSVTVNDVTAPVVATRTVTVTLMNGTALVTAAQVDNGSSDACGIASFSLNRKLFGCADLGTSSVILTATDASGNVASASAVVVVLGSIPAPAIAVTAIGNVYTGGVASNLYLGYGAQNATLTASGGVRYAWSPAMGLSNAAIANPVFTATAAGSFTYTVTATNQSGCTATKSVTLKVMDVRTGNNKVVVCHNGHEISISPNAVGAHLANHGDQLGACGTAGRSAAGSVAAAAAGSGSNELAAYPNPTAGQATVSFRTLLDAQAKLVVYNQLGQRVATLYDGAVNGGQLYSLTLTDRDWATGLYQCQLVVNGKAETLRLVIAR